MTDPTTDPAQTVPRPGGPRSPRMTEDEVWQFVTDAHTGILTTLRRDGVPIAMPVWFTCLDRLIHTRTRGKKLARIEHDPRASFLVESGERWVELKAVHLTGRAEIVELDAELAARHAAELERKYAAFRAEGDAMPEQARQHYATVRHEIVRFTPDARVLNWDNAKLSG